MREFVEEADDLSKNFLYNVLYTDLIGYIHTYKMYNHTKKEEHYYLV